jgi:hypothetical protein
MLNNPQVTPVIKQVLESMKKEEHSKTVVEPDWVKTQDEVFGPQLESEQDLVTVDITLHKIVKMEDWFSDGGKTLKRHILRGKGDKPFEDSSVLMFFKFLVNGQTIVDNFPANFDMENPESRIVLPKCLKMNRDNLGTQAVDNKDDENEQPSIPPPDKKDEVVEEMKKQVEEVVTEADLANKEAEEKRDQETLEKFGELTPYQVKLNEYTLPPLVLKVI